MICKCRRPVPRTHLDDRLLGNGARPALAGVEPLFHGEAAAMGLEPLHQQVVDGGKVVVAFVLQRLEEERQWAGEQHSKSWTFPSRLLNYD